MAAIRQETSKSGQNVVRIYSRTRLSYVFAAAVQDTEKVTGHVKSVIIDSAQLIGFSLFDPSVRYTFLGKSSLADFHC